MGNVIELNKSKIKKVRCFIIADDYRWHLLTTSIEEFETTTAAYLNLMNNSAKENNYYFKNIFMTEEEYTQTKILMGKSEPVKQKPKRHLELVTDH